jgi:hypothetical protein
VGTTEADGARLRIAERRRESRSIANPRTGDEYGEDLAVLVVSGLPSGARIANVTAKMGPFYQWKHHGSLGVDFTLDYEQRGNDLVVRFPQRTPPREYLSLMLSCHDDGWEGFPAGTNPYVARGSRFVFGYAALLVPAIPLFMSGEEFDADFLPLPRLSPHLFGGKEAGKGTWLYGSWLPWDQLAKPRHRDMLEDVRDLIALRRRFSHLIRPFRRESALTGFFSLSGHRPASLPVPYAYCDESSMLIVAGNPSREADARIEIALPWDRLPMRAARSFIVRDVWNGSAATRKAAQRPSKLSLTIPRDGRKKGGLSVWEIRCSD